MDTAGEFRFPQSRRAVHYYVHTYANILSYALRKFCNFSYVLFTQFVKIVLRTRTPIEVDVL